MVIRMLLFLLFFACSFILYSQSSDIQYTYQTFRDTRIINGHSVESGPQGELKFIISHRFGTLDGGVQKLYGLDESFIRIGLDYAVTNNLDVGIGRSSNDKLYDFFGKYKFISQSSGDKNVPVSVSFLFNTAINSDRRPSTLVEHPIENRFSYTSQFLIGRKFSDRFSMQVMPTYFHDNYVDSARQTNDLVYLGTAGKIQLTKVMAVQFEYYHLLSGVRERNTDNSLSVGFEFQTKGHVFQFSLSNSIGMTESAYLSSTSGDWSGGDIRLGFNITRDFRIGPRKFKN